MITRDLRGAIRVDGKMVPVERSSRVLLPRVSVVNTGPKTVLRIDGSTMAPEGQTSGLYLTDHGTFTDNANEATNIRGDRGSSAATVLGTCVVAQNAAVAISAGVRTVTINNVSGVKKDDRIILFPLAALPTGYLLQPVAVASADGVLRVNLIAPLLSLGASYSITCQVVRIDAA